LLSELDLNFMSDVAGTPRGNGILVCIQCGRCSSGCPVARLTSEHNPRRLMEMVILGLRKDVLSTQLPWYCLSCFTCLDRCPQGGDVGDVMFAIRNQAVRQGNMPAGVAAQAKALYETTRVINPIRSAIDKRASLGLGQLDNESLDDVQKILKRTGMDKLLPPT
jgi:heterodisulfide reductase subunit C